MLQERAPLLGVTVELVQSVTIALLVGFLAVAVLAAAILGFAWGKAKIATEKLRAWYAEIATRRVMNDAKRSQRLPPADAPSPATLRTGSPQPIRPANTPQPPPLPTIPIEAAKAPPRPRPRPPAALAQTSPDWSDDRRKTQRTAPPEPVLPPFDAHSRKTQRLPRLPRAGDEVTEDELDFSGLLEDDDAHDPDE